MERTRGLKLAWLAFMLLQLALPSWSVIADARSLGPLPIADIHMEADGCEPSHPLDCRLCSYAGSAGDLSHGLPEIPFPATGADATLGATAAWVSLPASRSPLPRGPPA